MATKKVAKKKIAAAVEDESTGKALQPWEARMLAKAQEAAATASSVAGSSPSIKTRGGRFTIDGAEVEGNVLRCIVLDGIIDQHLYEDDFDPDDLSSPVCWALGRNYKPDANGDMMGPNPDEVEDAKSDKCFTCPLGGKDAWGTADKGKGKACKSTRRLLLISEDDFEEDIMSAEVRKLTVPVTSGKAWDGYVKMIGAHNRPPCGVLTEITIVPDAKTQFKLEFKMLGKVEDDSMSEVMDKVETIQDELFSGYGKNDEEEDEKPAKRSKAVAKGAKARKR